MTRKIEKREDFFQENFRILSNVIFGLCMFASVLKIEFTSTDLAEPELLKLLAYNINALLNFAVAFVFLALFWIKFIARLNHIARIDNGLMTLWLIYLATLCLYPFAENVLGNYPGSIVAQVTFSSLWALIGLVSLFTWWYAYRKQLIYEGMSKMTIDRLLYECFPEPIFALLSIPCALISDWAYYLTLLLTIPANIWIGRRFPDSIPEDNQA